MKLKNNPTVKISAKSDQRFLRYDDFFSAINFFEIFPLNARTFNGASNKAHIFPALQTKISVASFQQYCAVEVKAAKCDLQCISPSQQGRQQLHQSAQETQTHLHSGSFILN